MGLSLRRANALLNLISSVKVPRKREEVLGPYTFPDIYGCIYPTVLAVHTFLTSLLAGGSMMDVIKTAGRSIITREDGLILCGNGDLNASPDVHP